MIQDDFDCGAFIDPADESVHETAGHSWPQMTNQAWQGVFLAILSGGSIPKLCGTHQSTTVGSGKPWVRRMLNEQVSNRSTRAGSSMSKYRRNLSQYEASANYLRRNDGRAAMKGDGRNNKDYPQATQLGQTRWHQPNSQPKENEGHILLSLFLKTAYVKMLQAVPTAR